MSQSKNKINRIASRILIFFVVFIIMLQLLGVPLGWFFGNMIPLSAISIDRNMDVEIAWDAPLIPGQNVEVLVIDSENRSPIQGAKVTISKDGSKITDLSTDENGLTCFEYPGETTIVEVKKEGYRPVMKVVPHVPLKWYIGIVSSLIISIVGSIIGGVILKFITHSLSKRKHRKRKIR